MPDIIIASIIVALPLIGIMFIIDKLSRMVLRDGINITNKVQINVSHPADMKVDFGSKIDQNNDE